MFLTLWAFGSVGTFLYALSKQERTSITMGQLLGWSAVGFVVAALLDAAMGSL